MNATNGALRAMFVVLLGVSAAAAQDIPRDGTWIQLFNGKGPRRLDAEDHGLRGRATISAIPSGSKTAC